MVAIIPGLTGNGDEIYCKNVAQAAIDNNYNVCVINHWGALKTVVTSPKLYCAGSSWDVKEAMEYLSETFSNMKFFGVGFSLGANILGKYQAEEGLKSLLKAAVCINGPLDILEASHNVENMWKGIFSKFLAKSLKEKFLEHEDCHGMIEEAHYIDMQHELSKCFTMKDVDHYVTSRVMGFKDGDDYYRSVGCA